jgi:hypothetical protein
MKTIISQVQEGKLLHIVHRLEPDTAGTIERTEIAPPEQFLQLCLLRVEEGRSFPPHKHIWKEPSYSSVIAQESWIVVRGSVRVHFYDLDDKLLASEILEQGDCSMTFEGGHSYEIIEPNTIVYEYKTGPYRGQKLDKEFINED